MLLSVHKGLERFDPIEDSSQLHPVVAPGEMLVLATSIFNRKTLQDAPVLPPPLFAILFLSGETESGSAGEQPDKG